MTPFGSTLKTWRELKKVSQLDLATSSGMSQRHISFLETGRARPSRGAALNLAACLDVPLRERNRWLLDAGFAPEYRETPLDESALIAFRAALESMLEHHEPFPGFILDGRWNPVAMNRGAIRLFTMFVEPAALETHTDFRIIRICMSETGLKPYLENWTEVMRALLQRCRRGLAANPCDTSLATLVGEISDQIENETGRRELDSDAVAPVIDLELVKDGVRANFFTVLANFGAAQDITLEELRLELLFPTDAATRDLLTRLT